jgi:hypothetical protein
MIKTYRINFWHGIEKNSRCFKKIQEICELADPGSDGEEVVYHFTGTLDEFDSLYDGNFMLYKNNQIGGLHILAVTHYKSFAAR